MKLFLSKFVLLISIIFISIVLMLLIIDVIISKNAIYKIDKSPKHIVLGNSRPQCAFNDSLINSFSNLGHFAESYFYTNIKAKKIIEKNKSIQIIFIEIAHDQIDKEIDDWTWSDKNLEYRYWRYFSHMSFEDHKFIFKKNPKGFSNTQFPIIKQNGMNIIKNDFNYLNKIGGYKHITYNNLDLLSSNLETSFEQQTKVIKIAHINIKYLKKLIKYCQEGGKAVYLIRCPLHKKYLENSNENTLKNVLTSNFSNVEFLDFSSFPLENADYIDLTHLNDKGARKFSIWFNQLIDDGILNLPNKQKIINERIDFLNKKHKTCPFPNIMEPPK